MGTKNIEIMGVPYGFAKKKLKKPYHAEPVLLELFPATCPNGCGLIYLAPDPMNKDKPKKGADNTCPDCKHVFTPFQVSTQRDEVEVLVKMAFGNVSAVELLRVIGPAVVRQVQLQPGVAPGPSHVIVTP